jgi:hypothetical protein
MNSAEKSSTRGLWLTPQLRERHLYLIGKTRSGKTTLLKNLLIQDMRLGHGVGFLDPHGDAAYELLGHVPAERLQDVIYFDPSSPWSPAFNIFQLPYPAHKLTEDIISLFKLFFGSSWGYRLEHLFRFGLLTLLTDQEPHTLRDLRSLFLDPSFRGRIIRSIRNASLREFWEREFPTIEKGAVNPLVNKLSAFLLPGSPLERIFSQPENDLNFTHILNTQKILIVNLAKGTLGDEPSRLLGGLITTGIQQAALARVDLAEWQRKDFFLFVDEFHNYSVASFETILSESSKYRLFLTMANQNLGQIPQTLERAIFGNVGTLISFQVSAEDAATLQKEIRRSRLMWRPKHTRYQVATDYLPLRDFFDEGIKSWRYHIAHFEHQLADLATKCATTQRTYADHPDQLARAMADLEHQKHNLRRYIENATALLEEASRLDPESPDITLAMLQRLFPSNYSNLEFHAYAYPNVDDFINLPRYHAFCRAGRADNVFPIRTTPTPAPNAAIRNTILQDTRRRFEARQKVRPEPTRLPMRREEPVYESQVYEPEIEEPLRPTQATSEEPQGPVAATFEAIRVKIFKTGTKGQPRTKREQAYKGDSQQSPPRFFRQDQKKLRRREEPHWSPPPKPPKDDDDFGF